LVFFGLKSKWIPAFAGMTGLFGGSLAVRSSVLDRILRRQFHGEAEARNACDLPPDEARGRKTRETDPLGNVTKYTYDTAGYLLTTTKPRIVPGHRRSGDGSRGAGAIQLEPDTPAQQQSRTQMFDFKKEKGLAERLIRSALEPVFAGTRYALARGNWWELDCGWCLKRCNLGLRQAGLTKQPELIGGASLFVPQYYPIYRRDDYGKEEKHASIGAPIHWIDPRMTSETGRFDDLLGMEALLPRFAESIQTTVLPELERYRTEGDLLDALLADDWLTSVKLSATPDRRGALVTLMLWRREGAEFAAAWGMRELERIRAEKPFVTSTARYQELDRCIEYISALR
jgi:YD repeat-containing protein